MGFLPVPNPVAFTIFGFDIMWYGVIIVIGMILAVLLGCKRAQRYKLDPDRLIDFALYGIIAGVVGARLYYVAFEWDYYSQYPSEILNIRNGGLAIHGGLIFGVGLALILGRIWKEDMVKWFDIIAPCVALGQAVGRWGNYFNSEAHGIETTLPWAIYADGKLVHPTFLYESIWCFLLCIFLVWFDRSGKKAFDGQIAVLYLVLYSVERFFVEGLRTDSLWIGRFRQAQLISIGIILFALVLTVFWSRRWKKLNAWRLYADSTGCENCERREECLGHK